MDKFGWELQRSLAPLGEVISLDRNGLNQWCGDFSKPEGIDKLIVDIAPNVVVNASAYTAVDLAETEQDMANLINHVTVRI